MHSDTSNTNMRKGCIICHEVNLLRKLKYHDAVPYIAIKTKIQQKQQLLTLLRKRLSRVF